MFSALHSLKVVAVHDKVVKNKTYIIKVKYSVSEPKLHIHLEFYFRKNRLNFAWYVTKYVHMLL